MLKVAFFIFSLLLLAYPFFVYYGLQHFEPRLVALLIFALLISRLILAGRFLVWQRLKSILPLTLVGVLTCLMIILFNTESLLRLNPVLINLVMLIMFGWSLYRPPSMVERIARIAQPDLPPAAIIYTRQVTVVWCFFFVFNGLTALYTALYTSIEIWTFYNGFFAYILMGALFSGEYMVRLYKMKQDTKINQDTNMRHDR